MNSYFVQCIYKECSARNACAVLRVFAASTLVYMYIYNYQAIAMGKNALAWLLNSHTLATCLRLLVSCM